MIEVNSYLLPELSAKREQLSTICRQQEVLRLELFGSATGAGFDKESSDLDFLVEFSNQSVQGASDRFLGLRRQLIELFGREVDLVDIRAIRNPYFLEAIAPTRVAVYGD